MPRTHHRPKRARTPMTRTLVASVGFLAAFHMSCSLTSFFGGLSWQVYIFDRIFSEVTLAALAKVLQRSSFYVMVSSRKPRVWWDAGLSKVQPVAKMRFVTTGRERCTAFIYINSHFIPGIG